MLWDRRSGRGRGGADGRLGGKCVHAGSEGTIFVVLVAVVGIDGIGIWFGAARCC